jgi:hypothetical protein
MNSLKLLPPNSPNLTTTFGNTRVDVTQHPPMHHPLKMYYDSVVDEPQLTLLHPQLSYQGST